MIDNTQSNEKTRATVGNTGADRTVGSRDLTLGSRDNMAVSSRNSLQNQFRPGDWIDSRYQIISVIGSGGFGCVYKVNQVLLKKEFALKTLNPMNMSEVTVLRLRKEAQAASRLEHPNLVKAVDFGMIDGSQPFLVMDLVEGPTLAQYLKENGRLSLEEALRIFIPLAQAVAYAHRQGVVHRDLKPSNVILASDKSAAAEFIPKIVDFGIAKIRFADESQALSLTSTGDVFGTPLYMSPEQCAGTGVDARSDIYSLGCMLFEALTGAPPFNGRNPLEVMMQHSSAPLPSLKEASLGETFAPELERIVSSMLAKLPDERYSNSQKVADDLFWLQHGDFDRISTIAQTGAVVTRQQERKQGALHTAFVGVACTIIGAVIAYGAALVTSPPQRTEPVAQAHEATFLSLGADAEDAFLSKDNETTRTFKFPKVRGTKPTVGVQKGKKALDKLWKDNDHEIGWGSLYWWEKANNPKDANARHAVTAAIPVDGRPVDVPKTANLIFTVGFEAVQYPYVWGQFRANDLYGVILSKNTCSFNDATMNQVVCSLMFQNDLRILAMNYLTISAKSLRSLEEMSNLRWLDMSKVWVKESAAEDQPPHVTGSQIANFSFLPKLRVLRLESVSDVSPVLKRLATGSELRWLSLANDDCSDDDVKLIGKLHNLEVLDLRGSDNLNGVKIFESLRSLKKLKTLLVDVSVLESLKPEVLMSLPGVKVVVVHQKNHQPGEDLMKSVASCVLDSDDDADKDLFNCLRKDPASVGS